MKKKYYLGFIAVVLLSGCSPRITTDIAKFYEPSTQAKDVTVYDMGQPAPNSAEVIGRVFVGDTGFSSSYTYDESVGFAKQEVAKVGGNGLAITDHILPSFWGSTMNQIEGQMLYMTDTTILLDLDVSNPFVIAAQYREKQRKEFTTPTHTLYANIGYTSTWGTELSYADDTPIDKLSGIEWQIGYDWMPSKRSIFGLGMMYTGQRFNLDQSGIDMYITHNYFAPQVILKGKVGSKFMLKYAWGIGYALSKEGFSNNHMLSSAIEHCFGMNMLCGGEYQVNDNLGIGFNINFVIIQFPDGAAGAPDGDIYGIKTFSFNGGLRYYF